MISLLHKEIAGLLSEHLRVVNELGLAVEEAAHERFFVSLHLFELLLCLVAGAKQASA